MSGTGHNLVAYASGPQALLGTLHSAGQMVMSTSEAADDQVLGATALGGLG